MSLFSPNKASAKLLVEFADQTFGTQADKTSAGDQKRYLLVYDLYIKARSYLIINKVCFWLAIVAGLLVLIWPSIAIVTQDFGIEYQFWKSAVVQTTVTGLAALTFAVYSHYKKRQMHMENLMRYVIYSEDPLPELVDKLLKEMERIDAGFSFSESVLKKGKSV